MSERPAAAGWKASGFRSDLSELATPGTLRLVLRTQPRSLRTSFQTANTTWVGERPDKFPSGLLERESRSEKLEKPALVGGPIHTYRRHVLMSHKATVRAMEAAERRRQRESQRRLRELERQAKEQAKLSAIEQARLEVETFDKQLEVLLSVHKEQGETWDWTALAASLPPPCPQRNSYHEQRAKQRLTVLLNQHRETSQSLLEQARLHDEQDFEKSMHTYSERMAEWEKLKCMARRILAGEHAAYTEALIEFNPFAEISDLGSAIHFTVHSAKLVECALKVNGRQAIPAEVKTLTSSGKVSVKPMPKARFHEIYQDYLCGCVLRVAREMFALFPIETILVTATADSLNPSTGQTVERPVLSVAMPRAVVAQLDFDRLDPSDAMETFQRRGDLKASRKLESFQSVIPLTPADIAQTSIEHMGFSDLLANIQSMREELKSTVAQLEQHATDAIPHASPSS